MEGHRNAAPIVLVLAFALLWLPLGQRDFLERHWMHLGLGGSGFVLLGALAFRSKKRDRGDDVRTFNLLLLAAYLIHQFEEHGVDALGRAYAFMRNANALLGPVVGCAPDTPCPLNPRRSSGGIPLSCGGP